MSQSAESNEVIVFYKTKDNPREIDVRIKNESVWLNQKQLAHLLNVDTDTIGLHIRNIFSEKELKKSATTEYSSVVQKEGARNVRRKLLYYNLDVIISVGYRVKSKRGTEFRIWANGILKDYLVNGYALNQKRLTETREKLKEVTASVKLLGRIIQRNSLHEDENTAFLVLIKDYAFALDILDRYDHKIIDDIEGTKTAALKIEIDEAKELLSKLRKENTTSDLFGRMKDNSFESSLHAVFQTFGGNDLYPSIEDKAAHLLYFVVKNHSFIDGNKRIGAFLFIYFLNKNKFLLTEDGNPRISNETLVALTILIAESNPKERRIIINLIKHLMHYKKM